MQLMPREREHQKRGNWHFDWTKESSRDVIWAQSDFPREYCKQLEEKVLDIVLNQWSDHEEYLVPQTADFAAAGKAKSNWHTRTHPEAEIDMREAYEPFLDSKIWVKTTWNINFKPIPGMEIYDLAESMLKELNWLDGNERADTRYLIQFPGMTTFNHVDHVYKNYEIRADRYENAHSIKALMAITDREPGQYMHWGNQLIADWKAGQMFTWGWAIPHWTANYSNKPRVTMSMRLKEDVLPSQFGDNR